MAWGIGPFRRRFFVKIITSRFGELQVNSDDLITFRDGLLGFDNLKRFFVVDPGDNTFILWLQSADDGKVAFPIIEPQIFAHDYDVQLTPFEINNLGLDNPGDARVYSILTITQDITEMTANLKAPIVINNKNKLGKQVILQDSKLSVKHEMYKELRRSIVNYASDDSRRTTVDVGVGVTLNPAATSKPAQPEAKPNELN